MNGPLWLHLVAAGALLLAARQDERILTWQGRQRSTQDLADLPVPARAAVEAWRAFALERDYRMVLDPEARLLYVSAETNNLAERHAELAQQTAEVFDRALPPPPATTEASAAAGAPRAPATGDQDEDEIPEDPQGPPPGWSPPPAITVVPDYVWGAAEIAPDSDTMVVLALHDEDDYHAALDVLAKLQPYLEAWKEEAKRDLGFVLELPLAAGFVLNAAELEEWNPENELVHRVARLFLLRRFGQQPHWLALGWAWYVEFQVQGAVYCFPNRREFVWATEHTDWDVAVAAWLSRSKGKLGFERFAGWKRGTFELDAARLSWAVVDWIVRKRPGQLPLVLDDLRRFHDEHSRKPTSATTWERIRGYEIPVAEQAAIFERRLGKGFLEELKRELAGGE